jgi:hypothetical protein
MATNFGTADGILQVNYIGKMREVINNSCKLLQNMKKTGVTWNGSEGIVSVHVAHAQNIGFSAAGLVPAVTTAEVVKQFRISACKLYGAFSIDGELITASDGSNNKAFVSAVTLYTKGLAESIAIAQNKVTYSGGRCLGFLNELKLAAGAADWQFSGDTDKMQAVLTAKAGPVSCDFYRMDTYATLATVNVSAVTAGSTGTIHLDGAMDSSALPAGACIGVKVVDAAPALAFMDDETLGVYGNAIEPTLFGLDRTSATGYATLQFNNRAAIRTGTQARAAFALPQFQAELDDIMVASNKAPDRIFVHTNFRSTYATLFEAKMNIMLVQGKEAVGYNGGVPVDGKGDQKYAYAGIDIEQDRHCARGLAIFLKDDTWIWAQRMVGDFDKTTGTYFKPVYSGSQLVDKFQCFWKNYYNLICCEGFSNGVLVGLPLA